MTGGLEGVDQRKPQEDLGGAEAGRIGCQRGWVGVRRFINPEAVEERSWEGAFFGGERGGEAPGCGCWELRKGVKGGAWLGKGKRWWQG